ncbi:MAG: response regulator transcription factor [Pseudomonadota bacterium]|nr:response regulator transcription factor [Pseudomonadota bacterium]
MRVLLVEDDRALARELQQGLRANGYAADLATDGIDAEHMAREEGYDLIVLDLGLPGRPGLEVLHNLRADQVETPVIILTARDAWHEKVEGFKAGADDYVSKPFHTEELFARMQAVIRRSMTRSTSGLSAAGLTLDEEHQTVTTQSGESHPLTGTEFRLLRYLMMNRGKVLSKSRLAEHLYEFDDERDSNVIEVYVNRLRQKFGKNLIRTRRGQGYVFGEEE